MCNSCNSCPNNAGCGCNGTDTIGNSLLYDILNNLFGEPSSGCGCGCNGGNTGCGCNGEDYYARQYALGPYAVSGCPCNGG